MNWEVRGLSLDGDNSTAVLAPISQLSMASALDYYAGKREKKLVEQLVVHSMMNMYRCNNECSRQRARTCTGLMRSTDVYGA